MGYSKITTTVLLICLLISINVKANILDDIDELINSAGNYFKTDTEKEQETEERKKERIVYEDVICEYEEEKFIEIGEYYDGEKRQIDDNYPIIFYTSKDRNCIFQTNPESKNTITLHYHRDVSLTRGPFAYVSGYQLIHVFTHNEIEKHYEAIAKEVMKRPQTYYPVLHYTTYDGNITFKIKGYDNLICKAYDFPTGGGNAIGCFEASSCNENYYCSISASIPLTNLGYDDSFDLLKEVYDTPWSLPEKYNLDNLLNE
ncbi:MAG: hypothetical protein ABIA04_07545 [Pseudomonadota bacterium]